MVYHDVKDMWRKVKEGSIFTFGEFLSCCFWLKNSRQLSEKTFFSFQFFKNPMEWQKIFFSLNVKAT